MNYLQQMDLVSEAAGLGKISEELGTTDIKTEVNNLCECEPKCMSTEFINADCKGLKSPQLNKFIDSEIADPKKWEDGEYKPHKCIEDKCLDVSHWEPADEPLVREGNPIEQDEQI